MFKINNKDTYRLIWRYFRPRPSVSNVLKHLRPQHTIVICEKSCCSTDLEATIVISQAAFDCSNSTMQTLSQGVKYVQI